MMRAPVLACVLVAASCATTWMPHDDVPQSNADWRTYAHRWGRTSEAALRVHLAQVWQCTDVEVKPAGVSSLVDDVGERTPALEWEAVGCEKDGHYLVTCPTTSTIMGIAPKAGEVACDVRHKHVVAQGLPAVVNDVGGVVVVPDVGATSSARAPAAP